VKVELVVSIINADSLESEPGERRAKVLCRLMIRKGKREGTI
jgi:hypothetical protein